MTTHLVISGGGVKGGAIIGALQVIADRGHFDTIHTFAGSSAGAILCMLIAVGYTPAELHRILLEINLQDYIDYNFIDFFQNIGISNGEDLIRLMGVMLRKKGVDKSITFSQLYELLGKTLVMTGSNLTKERVDYFSPEATPDMEVLTAVRITISYPFFFSPVLYNGSLYIDGALFDPYPINLYPDVEKIGILLGSERVFNEDYEANNNIEGFEQYLYILIKTITARYVRLSCNDCFGDTIGIDLAHCHSMNFGVDRDTKITMYHAGVRAANQYFAKSEVKTTENTEEVLTNFDNE